MIVKRVAAGGLLFVVFVALAIGIYLVLDSIDQADTSSPAVVDMSEDTTVTSTDENPPDVTVPQTTGDGISIIAPPQDLLDFTFVANTGEPLSLSDLEGQYILLSFGYTHCPDVCPANLLDYRQIKRSLGELSDNVTFMFISVDPERDTPEFLDRYLERYDPSFIGLSGEHEELSRIARDYNLFWEIRDNTGTGAGYLVDHTASRFLISPTGELIRVYSFTTTPQAIEADLRALLDAEAIAFSN
ncbi:MAG: SCO family protein [Chloroflexota bacterium]